MLRLLTDTYDSEAAEWRYLPGLHTGGGVKGVASGELEIGAASRELTDEEIALGQVYTPLSDDGREPESSTDYRAGRSAKCDASFEYRSRDPPFARLGAAR